MSDNSRSNFFCSFRLVLIGLLGVASLLYLATAIWNETEFVEKDRDNVSFAPTSTIDWIKLAGSIAISSTSSTSTSTTSARNNTKSKSKSSNNNDIGGTTTTLLQPPKSPPTAMSIQKNHTIVNNTSTTTTNDNPTALTQAQPNATAGSITTATAATTVSKLSNDTTSASASANANANASASASANARDATANDTIPLASSIMAPPEERIIPVTNSSSDSSTPIHIIAPFTKQPGVVIATKLHGIHQIMLLEQMLCLLHHAYNSRVLYDIVVFTTTPLSEKQMELSRSLVHPAKLTVVVDNRGLQEEITALSDIRRELFLERCNVTSPVNLTWWSRCPGRIAYNWQAEFRSWHIWHNPALDDYKYMMWLDTDGFCTKEWEQDPIQYMIQNDLVMLFDNFPQGAAKGRPIQERVFKAFNTTLCSLQLKQGKLVTKTGPNCYTRNIPDIHGFFHITNLDFYRSPKVMYWAETLIGDCFLCRKFDDQVAVTVPAAILEPDRSHDMRSNGIKLDVYHNFFLDGKKKRAAGGFLKRWKTHVQHNLTSALHCPIKAAN